MTMTFRPRVNARARPGALPMPANRKISAFAPASVYDRWGEDAAGIRAAAGGDNVITMFDDIGEDYWSGGGITAKKVDAQLRAIGDRPVEVQINSPGGDMFEGIAIYNVLREHPQDITIKVMGMAASAASLVAMAGDRIEIGVSSFLMIHNCWVMAMGNRHDMAEVSAWLAPFDQSMIDLYALRTDASAEEIGAMMDAETWLSGSTAIEKGFADALLPADQMKRDESAQAADRRVNELRAMELTLVRAGYTRSEARARIHKIKGDGTPGAAVDLDNPTPGAGDSELAGALTGLLSTIRS
ncbi:head maturation protease, ClpP-related [Novosphingobium album (ex Liu et al. 2023)]|uniref:ATP-dependent Clp protease proteolytic subunit n=1 Tax=Novosphingobium album (ex Liu et al. 2023) TaxID=3031130 RepID=A0ABT5WY21_9SPHN|nr:head maturation protease, ClpP-related [Novosphingobium album (ex Liu et al. 2023)]MDE8654779.1 Clp protease ClpP [Novosphingobium album (ex Liu et al. 2023)]